MVKKKNNKITQKHLAMRLLSTALNNNKNQHFYKKEKYQTCRLRTQQTLKGDRETDMETDVST